MDYCNECRSRECEYIEVVEFFKYISEYMDKDFKISNCPDKSHADYTCDMVVLDDTNEKMYIEIKEVKYGFGMNKDMNKNIGESNAQLEYSNLILYVKNKCDDRKQAVLDNFILIIPKGQIHSGEKQDFCDKLFEYINSKTFDGDSYDFLFERKKEKMKISFNRKTKNIEEKFGKGIIIAYENECDNTFESIFNKMTDIDSLDTLLIKNSKNTSEKKFPETADRKILLNIFRCPLGYDMFFNLDFQNIVSEIMSKSNNYKSAADECYLLYYCNGYYEPVEKKGVPKPMRAETVLFIIPLIKGLITRPVKYVIE